MRSLKSVKNATKLPRWSRGCDSLQFSATDKRQMSATETSNRPPWSFLNARRQRQSRRRAAAVFRLLMRRLAWRSPSRRQTVGNPINRCAKLDVSSVCRRSSRLSRCWTMERRVPPHPGPPVHSSRLWMYRQVEASQRPGSQPLTCLAGLPAAAASKVLFLYSSLAVRPSVRLSVFATPAQVAAVLSPLRCWHDCLMAAAAAAEWAWREWSVRC